MTTGNLYQSLPTPGAQVEEFTELFMSPHVRVERIVSHGHQSPEGFWYDQEENEWVILLEGEAEILFQDPEECTILGKGDWLLIPRHKKHRVTRTSSPAIWLAVWERKN